MSLGYYEENAHAYFESTAQVDMSAMRRRFLEHVRIGGAILDAGCGSGRDAKAFSEAGYEVTAFDGSAELVKLASAYTGLPVLHMTFDQMAWKDSFDGIWSCACLLHVGRADLTSTFDRFVRALKPNGVWYLSLKKGTTSRELDGRLFTDVTEAELTGLLENKGLQVLELWITDDVRPGRSDIWVNVIAQKF
jgi:2-polyprenyl-3-methyl-5-hydroxy-6-metoxy-1,4-benzoquinol methylase